jgi:hypothetical protein
LSNKSDVGAGVHFQCSKGMKDKCILTVELSTFTSNEALTKGGGVAYNLYRPTVKPDCIFNTNIAPYGPDVAGYPLMLKKIEAEGYS